MNSFILPFPLRRLVVVLGSLLGLILPSPQAWALPPLKPTIYAFLVLGENLITSGDSTVLAWSVGNATTVSIAPDIGVVNGTEIWVAPKATTTYTLTATNAAGSVTQTRKVTVAPVVRSMLAAPDSILAGAAARVGPVRASRGPLAETNPDTRVEDSDGR